MALRISLGQGEKLVVNGAILCASVPTDLLIEGSVALLREREIMAEAEAVTPARRLYYHVMTAYLVGAGDDAHYLAILAAMKEIARSLQCDKARAACARLARRVAGGDYFPALSDCRLLIRLEQDALIDAGEIAA